MPFNNLKDSEKFSGDKIHTGTLSARSEIAQNLIFLG